MKVTKITENKYLFYQEGSDYILNLGTITRGEDTTTELLFENIEDVKKLSVNSTCGCSTAERTEVDNNTLRVKIKYSNCDSIFSKILNCINNKQQFKIKIKGVCQ